LVALDGVMATALGITALSIAGDSSEPAIALLPLGLGALYLAGAVSGNRAVNKCRESLDEYERGYRGEMFANQGGPPLDDDDEDPATTKKKKGKKKMIPRTQSAYAGQEPYPQQGPQPQQPLYPPQYPPPQQPPAQQAPSQPPPQQQPQQQPPQQQAAPRPAPSKPAPRQEPEENDWSDFWREVP
jgi:hypothetical protein